MNGDGVYQNISMWKGPASVVWIAVLLAWESFSPFFPLFASGKLRLKHGFTNLFVGIANVAITALIFAGVWRWISGLAEKNGWGLLHLVALPSVVHGVFAVILLDAWTYWWHRVCHQVPALWRFHKVHHSDATMDVTTASRFHAGEIILSSLLRIPLIPLLGIRFGDLVIYETLLMLVVQWQHANIGLPEPLERWSRAFVVTPGMHKVHHSRERSETDSNYSSISSVWDRIFGSYKTHPKPSEIRFGLDDLDAPEKQTVSGLFRQPLD
jgi:sterol desaturase/sphingolipid hydroxylase (fatty acid hydroxylase superfamily)